MRAVILLCSLVALSGPAWAQQPPSVPYAPITISEASYKEITAWLMDQPARFSIPMLQWFEGQQRAARLKAEPPPPKPDGK